MENVALKDRKYFWPVMYLISIILGNYFVIKFGIIHVAGLTFPAGVVFVGLTFSFRDFVQKRWGDKACWIWMIVATIITFFLNIQIALASVTAFAVSEGVDWFLFKYLQLSLKKRIMFSNLLSCPLDSMIFVTIAFGWFWPAIWGQALIKYLSGLLVLPFIKPVPYQTISQSGLKGARAGAAARNRFK
jgi:uncharacterized PurR-regulated membrane protein YhhQ (DUF165 family)